MKQTQQQKLTNLNPEAILYDSRFDSAFIGIGQVAHFGHIAIYSKKAIYGILADIGINGHDIDEYYTGHFLILTGGKNAPVIFDDTITEDN
jgi:hypothetical protein